MKTINESFFDEFIERLNKSEITYLILRNYKLLPKVGNDIDFLVAEPQLDGAILNLLSSARDNNVTIRPCLRRYGLVSFLCSIDESVIQVDFFTKLVKKWCPYADHNVVLDARIKFKNFYVPDDSHELLLISLKEILTYGYVRDKYIDDFNRDISITLDELYKICGNYFTNYDLERFINHINNKLIFKNKLTLSRSINSLCKPFEFIAWFSKRFN